VKRKTVSTSHLHHDALAILHEERRDEDKEDVVEEESGEEAGADLEAGKPQHLQHVHREHHPQQVLILYNIPLVWGKLSKEEEKTGGKVKEKAIKRKE
jgi:hypothetical protein